MLQSATTAAGLRGGIPEEGWAREASLASSISTGQTPRKINADRLHPLMLFSGSLALCRNVVSYRAGVCRDVLKDIWTLRCPLPSLGV